MKVLLENYLKVGRQGRKRRGEERAREKRREMTLSKTTKLAQRTRAGELRKDATSGANLKLGRSKKNGVELLKNAPNHPQNL